MPSAVVIRRMITMRTPPSTDAFSTIDLTVPFRLHRLLAAAVAIVVAAAVLF
jgi:hypothetical protein